MLSNGKIIGMISLRLKDDSFNVIEGICYAIPIDVIDEYIISIT